MNKKGFTLIEILATITLLALLIVIGNVVTTKVFNNQKESIYIEQEKSIEEAKRLIILDIENCNTESDAEILNEDLEIFNFQTACNDATKCTCAEFKNALTEGLTLNFDKMLENGILIGSTFEKEEFKKKLETGGELEDVLNMQKDVLITPPIGGEDGSGSVPGEPGTPASTSTTTTTTTTSASEKIIYINYDSGNDSNNGSSSSLAVKTIERAITLAGTNRTKFVLNTNVVRTNFNEIPSNVTLQTNGTEKKIIYNFNYTGAEQTINLKRGKYQLEVWGAAGGDGRTGFGTAGKGGYSTGILNLTTSTNMYIYVGQEGIYYSGYYFTPTYSFNGGGSPDSSSSTDWGLTGYGGGGATDIRIASNTLNHRVIVAGGGGGASGTEQSGFTGYEANGGAGGGLEGLDGTNSYNQTTSRIGGTKGTQTAAGIAADNNTYIPASFGFGGMGKYGNGDCIQGGGGGGGWYGGGNGQHNGGGGAGGSGYVLTSSSEKPSNYQLTSQYYLTSANTYSGATKFYSPTGTEETGHDGNGYARISMIIN